MSLHASNGPDPSALVQRIMAKGLRHEDWIAYDAIMRLHRKATPAQRKAMAPHIEQANRRMGALEAIERRRITTAGAA